MKFPAAVLSPRVRQAVQDYAALNTIAAAVEAMQDGRASRMQLELIVALGDVAGERPPRIPLACPLGRRLANCGMLVARGSRGVVRRRPLGPV